MDIRPTKKQMLLFIAIPLIPLLLFWILPLFVSLWLSFTDWDYISPSFNYVGFDNYKNLVLSQDFIEACQHTLFYTVCSVIPIIILGFIIAIMINKVKHMSKFLQSTIFSPWITPMIGMSIVWSWLFNPSIGPINQVLNFFNLPQPQWLTDSNIAIWAVIIVTVWKNIGWASIFFSDAISKIPVSLFEVADIEGLTTWKKIRYILIPLVSPTTLFLTIISTLDCLQAYDQITVLTQGGPAGSTRTLLYLYYELGFEQFQMGPATALSIVILFISAILAFLSMRVSNKHIYY